MEQMLVDVPLPEGNEAPAVEQTPTEMGWHVTFGRKVGQRVIAAGVVLSFEPDTASAYAAFQIKARNFLARVDHHHNRMGHVVSMDKRTGKFVEMRWGPRREG